MSRCKQSLLTLFCLFNSINSNAAELATASVIDTSDYFKVVLGLFFVIGLFLASTFLFKRYGHGPMTGRGQLRIVDSLHLGNRERLVLVELKSKQILLAITPGQIKKLDIVDNITETETSFAPLMDDAKASISINEAQDLEPGNA
jgi:flagellar protein FliO/FliZ